MPTESPLVLAATENDPVFVPEAAELPFTASQDTVLVAVQVSVPEPPLVTVTVWPDGFVPPCIAENESEAGLRPMTGFEAVGNACAAVAGVSIWLNPGMAVDRCCIPRPLLVLSWIDEPGAATGDNGNALEAVPVEGVVLKAAPNDSHVAGAVVTDVVFVGAAVVDVLGLSAVESLLRVCVVVL